MNVDVENESQKTIDKIGQLLWKIMPDEAVEISFPGKVFENSGEGGAHWINRNGSIGHFPLGQRPYDVEDEIKRLARKLRQLPPFQKEPWTHFKATLTEDGKFNIQFAYIPEEDSWPGLFLRRVSDLTEDEANEYYIPVEDWKRAQQFASTGQGPGTTGRTGNG